MKTFSTLLLLAFVAVAMADTKPAGTGVPAFASTTTTTTPTTTTSTTATTTTQTTTTPTTTTQTTTTPTTTTQTTTTTPTTTTQTTTTTPTTTKQTTTTTPTTTTQTTTTTPTTTKQTTTTTPTTTTQTTTSTTTTTTQTTTTTTTPTTTTTQSTTTLPPTTTQPPKPDKSTVGNYTLDNGKNRCLMAQMELKIRLTSLQANGTYLLLPNKTSTGGSCDDNHATLILISEELKLTMSYSKNATSKKFFVSGVSFILTYDFSKKTKQAQTYTVTNESIHIFEAKLGQSYSCRTESLYMGQGLHLEVDHDRMQAFNFANNNDFGTTDPCPADQNNYKVAIAVGITLLVLVVIVVVAYILGRKRRNGGYQSL